MQEFLIHDSLYNKELTVIAQEETLENRKA